MISWPFSYVYIVNDPSVGARSVGRDPPDRPTQLFGGGLMGTAFRSDRGPAEQRKREKIWKLFYLRSRGTNVTSYNRQKEKSLLMQIIIPFVYDGKQKRK